MIKSKAALLFVLALSGPAAAQTAANLDAFRGLAPVTALENTAAGKAALAAHLAATGAIQDGSAHQPTLLPFPEQQQQSLRDAFSTTSNASQLADGLGSRLASVYQSKAAYSSADAHTDFSPAVAQVLVYGNSTTNSDSAAAKFFFANMKQQNGKPVSADAAAILPALGGKPDMFGRAYDLIAGGPGGDAFGNARPFQTEPHLTTYRGKNYFGAPTNSITYLYGPYQNLTDSPSYPSGHTTYGYTASLLLAVLVPQRYAEMVTRGAEYGNSRVILGAHYIMDVLGGRALAAYDVAQLLANKAGYAGVDRGGVKIDDFRKAVATARMDLTKGLEAGCGGTVAVCAKQDQSRFNDPDKNRAFYESTQTYGLPVVFAETAQGPEDVAKLAPEAGYLLTAAFPYLTLSQANSILTATEGPGGGFLDNGSAFGVYSRLNLYRAAEQAAAAAPKR